MNTSSDIKIKKPEIIQSLRSGFETIANKPYLMLLPIILDLFLWFGPAWRVDKYFSPFIQRLSALPGMNTTELSEILEGFQAAWYEIVANFNLATTLRTFPIGVPSLMVSKNPFIHPLGHPPMFNLESNSQVLGFWALFLLVGYFLGNIYFKNISSQIIDPMNRNTFKSMMHSFFQIILMPILLLMILFLLSIPVLLLITLITLISPAISQLVMIITAIILLWVIMPLIFTPHGIFFYKQNLIAAMMTSISVVKISMGQTAWFILVSYVMIEGLDYLWRTPAVDNWMLIVGIFGRAFVVTAVVAASFHFFIDATKFTQTVLNQKIKPS
jgi:hypothetical protein